MRNIILLGFLLISCAVVPARGQRRVIPLNEGWSFYFASDVRKAPDRQAVSLPHTWNAKEVFTAGLNYYRGTGTYEKTLVIPAGWQGQRLFLRFEGVNSTATVLVNHRWVGAHEGGYTAFCLEITHHVRTGENLLTVQASNAYRLDVLPLTGDFNVYGGIHRPVALLVTAPACITPLDYASSGVYLTPTAVSAKSARVTVLTKLSALKTEPMSVKASLLTATGKLVTEQTAAVPAGTQELRLALTVARPHLWNGQADPYLYQVRVQLLAGGRVVDEVRQPLGLRSFRVDPDNGFSLNGRYLDLHGFCRHEDVAGKGSALTPADHARDLALAREAGATSLRLTHYPHSEMFYDLCDRNGLVLWSEIPLVGPGGYPGAGYLPSPALEAHGQQVLVEMIRQQYNHPSVFFWGLFNELKLDYGRPDAYVQRMNALAHREDSTRLTTLATFQADTVFTALSDVVAWNKYYGWYSGQPAELGTWADQIHRLLPHRPVAISEYGAGGSAWQHEEAARPVDPGSRWHPEGGQARFHEGNWNELRVRPFIWGKYVWVLADFGSAVRTEGDTAGLNDKGLVSYDRQVKKDAFYFYKAHWNPEPMLYLTDRRFTRRVEARTAVKVYSNLNAVELLVNGVSLGRKPSTANRVITWEQVPLRKGANTVEVKGKSGRQVLTDRCEWKLAN